MTPRRATVIIALLLVLGVLATTAARTPGTSSQTSSQTSSGVGGDRVLSPAVVGAWMAHRDTSGAVLLDLLVLWRGTPGWWQRETSSGGRSSGSGSANAMEVRRGGLTLTVSLDARTRVARVQGKDVDVRDANVILVDDVDAAAGPRVARTVAVDPQLSTPTGIEMAIRRSPDLIAYLRCDVRLPDAKTQAMMDLVCAQIIGR
jgi:hypothetical protein